MIKKLKSAWLIARQWLRDANKWMVIGTWILALFALFTLLEMKRAAKLDQRAWVGVVGIQQFNFRIGPNFSIPFDLTNSGKTPALNVYSEVSMKSLEKDKEFTATYDNPQPIKPSYYVLQPQMHMILFTLPTDVSENQFGDITNSRGILYGYGRIKYNDIFGAEHHTTFCVMYWAGLSSPVGCNTYNSAD